jgi:hypothetical protein
MRTLLAVLCLSASIFAAGPREESHRYEVKWPSGIPLGEAQIRASRDGGNWVLELEIEASVPGYRVQDRYRSVVDGNLCSLEFEKEFEHGRKKGKEKTTFAGGKATRVTAGGGGTTEFDVPACPRDALAFLFYVRQEVARGRVPGPQKLYFGAAYDVRLQPGGVQTVNIADAPAQADKLQVTVTTAKGKLMVDLYLARDEVRSLGVARVPFAMGNFSMEWVR